MTVCIAAICPQVKRIVLVADAMVSSEHTSVQGAMKLAEVTAHDAWWMVMFAGHAPRFRQLVGRIKSELTGGSIDEMIGACERAYRIEWLKRVEMEILLPYNRTLDEFVAEGRESLGDARFGIVMDRIEQTTLDIDLLVGGYDAYGQPAIFELAANGVVTRIDQVWYHAIGIGRFSALGALYAVRGFNHDKHLENIIYRLCAGKFASESAPGVGKDTLVVVIGGDGFRNVLMPWQVEPIRKLWETEGQPQVPYGIADVVASAFAKWKGTPAASDGTGATTSAPRSEENDPS